MPNRRLQLFLQYKTSAEALQQAIDIAIHTTTIAQSKAQNGLGGAKAPYWGGVR